MLRGRKGQLILNWNSLILKHWQLLTADVIRQALAICAARILWILFSLLCRSLLYSYEPRRPCMMISAHVDLWCCWVCFFLWTVTFGVLSVSDDTCISSSLISYDKDHKQVLRKVGWNSQAWPSQYVDSQMNYHFFSVGWVSWVHTPHLIHRYGEIRIISHLFLPSPNPSSDLVILDYVRRLKGRALCRAFSDKITTKTLSMNHFDETATWNFVVSVFTSFTISIFYVFRCSLCTHHEILRVFATDRNSVMHTVLTAWMYNDRACFTSRPLCKLTTCCTPLWHLSFCWRS
jgi:hypothetical protein